MLKIVGIHEVSETPCFVEVDYYVPISFRTSALPTGGVRYVRLGNFRTELFELQLPLESYTVSGFTLVLTHRRLKEPSIGGGPIQVALPILSVPADRTFSGPMPRLDLQEEVRMGCFGDCAEIRLGEAETFNSAILYDRVKFLVLNDNLVGIQVLDLTQKEKEILREYFERLKRDLGRRYHPPGGK